MLFEQFFLHLFDQIFRQETCKKFNKLQQIFTNAQAQLQKRSKLFSFSNHTLTLAEVKKENKSFVFVLRTGLRSKTLTLMLLPFTGIVTPEDVCRRLRLNFM